MIKLKNNFLFQDNEFKFNKNEFLNRNLELNLNNLIFIKEKNFPPIIFEIKQILGI